MASPISWVKKPNKATFEKGCQNVERGGKKKRRRPVSINTEKRGGV